MTMTLLTLLEDLKRQPRALTPEEDLYLQRIGDEIRRAPHDTARWRVLEREGFHEFDWSTADADLFAKLTALRRAGMN
ncbi:hypothetical protein [Accumulibacter sp.]|uniref:hypothetical protein n=1 Tax=Accumulibacter sp. TaxID=2053492 RepID=UPI0025E64509|nr:hypothetical protein [Accumulibacter sp.]MCM8595171.1 hypothetical protein [Accumulibacter sp.]MCM8625610.1 hypothetical protein [Accumulibacter sp.]MDS4049317.1 hypothetical protein [Accumulibacter sp.]